MLVDDDDVVDTKLNRAVKSKVVKYGDSDDEVWNDTDSDAMDDSEDDDDEEVFHSLIQSFTQSLTCVFIKDEEEENESVNRKKPVKKSKDSKKAVKPTKAVVKTPIAKG